MSALPKIFCFVNTWYGPRGGDCVVVAMAEDGHVLGSHFSSNVAFAMRDIGHLPGTFQASRHAAFAAHYPDGFETVWVDDPRSHPGLTAACERNQELAASAADEESRVTHP